MEIRNVIKSKVISDVNNVFEELAKSGNPNNFCTCSQCRMDVICYVLNRIPPHYIVSHRGASRAQIEGIEQQQNAADISTLVYEGLKRINHNIRPHSHIEDGISEPDPKLPLFYVPTIVGRIFNGNNFTPLSDVDVELLRDGELVKMKDGNWPNPCRVVSSVEGNYSFLPVPVKASKADAHETFQYTIRVSAPEFETLTHFLKIPVKSEVQQADFFVMDRTFKLPDLYLFPPGEAEKRGYLD